MPVKHTDSDRTSSIVVVDGHCDSVDVARARDMSVPGRVVGSVAFIVMNSADCEISRGRETDSLDIWKLCQFKKVPVFHVFGEEI